MPESEVDCFVALLQDHLPSKTVQRIRSRNVFPFTFGLISGVLCVLGTRVPKYLGTS